MKISKKLLSLLLVVMLLATAIPFQVFATGSVQYTVDGEGPETDSDGVLTKDEFIAMMGLDEDTAFTTSVDALTWPQDLTTAFSVTYTRTINAEGSTVTETVAFAPYTEPKRDYSVVVKCGDTSCEKTIQTCSTPVEMTATEAAAKSGAADALALATAAGANETTKSLITEANFKSIFVGGTNITIYVKDCGDVSNPDQPTTTMVTITIVDAIKGNSTNNVAIGELYSKAVGTRAEPGYEFRGWLSEKLGRMVDLTKDVITQADTLTAVWSAPTAYRVTYKLNYTDAPLVTYGFTANQGDHIYNKLYSYIPERQGYVFRGWSILGKIIKETNDEFTYQSDVDAIAIWDKASNLDPDTALPNEKDGQTYLEIYVNGDTGTLVKRVNLTTGYPAYLKDGVITRAEAEAVARKYVTVKTGYKLAFEGLFNEETWHWFKNDPETDGAASIPADMWDDQYIFMMVNNVKKTTNADTSNPKTGDFILTGALTMMAVSSISAAAVYVTGKKRK